MSGNRSSLAPRVLLSEVCDRDIAQTDPRSRPGEDFRYIEISSVDNLGKRITEARTVRGSDAPTRARQLVRPGDVLLATTRPNLNAVALVPEELGGAVCSTGFCVLRARPDALDPHYLFLYVQSPSLIRGVSSLVVGALYPAVTDGQVYGQLISVPAVAEQRRIAARLTEQLGAVDRARQAAVEKAGAARDLSVAIVRAAFSRDVAERWPVRLLADAGDIASGVALGRQLRGKPSCMVPYLRVANVKDGFLELTEVKETEATDDEITELTLRRGDLLLTEGGDPDKLGRGCLWDEQLPRCIHQNHIFRVRLNGRQYLPEFVSLQVGSPYGKAYFLKHAKRTTGIATINRTVLAAFPLLSPSLSTQRAVVASVREAADSVRLTLEVSEAQLAAIEALPAALLREAFGEPI